MGSQGQGQSVAARSHSQVRRVQQPGQTGTQAGQTGPQVGEVGSLGQSQSESQPGQMELQAGEMGSPGQGQSGRSQVRQVPQARSDDRVT